MSGKVCTYLCLDHSCISGLFKGPYIYSPSHISSDSYPFLEPIFASFWFLYVIICIDILPSAIQRVQMVIDSL